LSGAGLAAEIPDYLQTEGRTRPQNGQERDWQQKNQTTYFLRAQQGHKMVRSKIGSRISDQTTYELRAEQGHKMVRSRIGSRKTRPLTN
jgi:hypothetical protein